MFESPGRQAQSVVTDGLNSGEAIDEKQDCDQGERNAAVEAVGTALNGSSDKSHISKEGGRGGNSGNKDRNSGTHKPYTGSYHTHFLVSCNLLIYRKMAKDSFS